MTGLENPQRRDTHYVSCCFLFVARNRAHSSEESFSYKPIQSLTTSEPLHHVVLSPAGHKDPVNVSV